MSMMRIRPTTNHQATSTSPAGGNSSRGSSCGSSSSCGDSSSLSPSHSYSFEVDGNHNNNNDDDDDDDEERAALMMEVDHKDNNASMPVGESLLDSHRQRRDRSRRWCLLLMILSVLLVCLVIVGGSVISSFSPSNSSSSPSSIPHASNKNSNNNNNNNNNNEAHDTGPNNDHGMAADSRSSNNLIKEEKGNDDEVSSGGGQQQQQQQAQAEDERVSEDVNDAIVVVPSWQSIVPDTGSIYPLMGGGADDTTTTTTTRPKWTLSSTDHAYRNIAVKGEPGDIITDLMNAKIMDEPYRDLNFIKQRTIWTGNITQIRGTRHTPKLEMRNRIWVYETAFELPSSSSDDTTTTTKILVVEGIKMGATIHFNDILLGTVTDQFLRYTFVVTSEMLMAANANNNGNNNKQQHKLTISFDPAIKTDGRFAGYSGGWDWAAYVPVGDERGSRVWTFGIYKHLYLVDVNQAYISHVVPKIYYQGNHSTQPMIDGPQADFDVQVDVHITFPSRGKNKNNNDGKNSLFLELTTDFAMTNKDKDKDGVPTGTTTRNTIKKLVPTIKKKANDDNGNEDEQEIIVSFNMTVSKDDIELWWPNGMGQQKLYNFQVRFVHQQLLPQQQQQQQGGSSSTTIWTTKLSSSPAIQKRIGFRTVALVTINDTDDTLVQQKQQEGDGNEGSGHHGMYFRINGALIWARGGNMIPMDQLEGRLSDEAHEELVRSTAAAKMNMMRIWGGGMVLPNSFYNACDEEGILLFHDMMFVSEHHHDAIETPTVSAELKHTIRSLANHPSIVLWNGCNECDSLNIFASYVMRLVADEDDSRPIWPNSPSNAGWGTGVHTLDGRPNGNKLTIGHAPIGSHSPFANFVGGQSLEKHSPYEHSYSRTYPTVNSVFGDHGTKIPATLSDEPIGPMYQNSFSSEFGSSVMSSFESMSGTLSPSEWNIHGSGPPAICERLVGHDLECEGDNVWSQRNYACDSHIVKFFGKIPFEEDFGAYPLQAQLFECMMGQALWMKGYFESLRSQNSFGALIWQLNENWPTGGWGAIEYGTPSVKGQVIGGRWKPLMHMFQNNLLRDVFATCGKNNKCLVRNDGIHSIDARVQLEFWILSEPLPIHNLTHFAALDGIGGKAATDFFVLESSNEFALAEVILIRVEDKDGTTLMRDNAFLKDTPMSIPGLTTQNVTISSSVRLSDNGRSAVITLESDFLALYVTLTTIEQGRFSENALHLRPSEKKEVEFVSPRDSPPVNVKELEATLRVEHLGSYL